MAILYQRKSGSIAALIFALSLISLLAALALFKLSSRQKSQIADTSLVKSQANTPLAAFSASHLEPGDTFVLRVAEEKTSTVPYALFGQNRLTFFKWGSDWLAMAGIDVNTPSGTTTLLLKLPDGTNINEEIVISKRTFDITEFKLPQELVAQGVTPQALRDKIASGDNQVLAAVFSKFSPDIEFSDAFSRPLQKWVDVGGFGVIRKSGSTELRHLGVDLEGERGEAVAAANNGLVSFAGQLENFGTSVVIDHGLGIHTAYLHLDKSMVRVGDRVFRGQTIGAVGSSGEYVLAPHLHFSVKIKGASVDPLRFLETTREFLK